MCLVFHSVMTYVTIHFSSVIMHGTELEYAIQITIYRFKFLKIHCNSLLRITSAGFSNKSVAGNHRTCINMNTALMRFCFRF